MDLYIKKALIAITGFFILFLITMYLQVSWEGIYDITLPLVISVSWFMITWVTDFIWEALDHEKEMRERNKAD